MNEVQIDTREEVREKILKTADELFQKYGIRSITMDDIAKELGISKKTIYQYFKDKNEMVLMTVERKYEKDLEEFVKEISQSSDSIDEMMRVAKCNNEILGRMNPSFLYDMKKYHPEAWAFCEEKDNEQILHHVTENLKRGIQDGLYRDDINIELMGLFVLAQNQLVFNDKYFPKDKFSLLELHSQLMEHFVRGIVTLKGFQQLEKYKNKNL